MAGIKQFLSKNVLSCWAAPFLGLWLERAGLVGASFVIPLGISELLPAPAPSLGYVRQRETQGLTTGSFLGSLGPRWSSLHLSELSYVCFVHDAQDF